MRRGITLGFIADDGGEMWEGDSGGGVTGVLSVGAPRSAADDHLDNQEDAQQKNQHESNCQGHNSRSHLPCLIACLRVRQILEGCCSK